MFQFHTGSIKAPATFLPLGACIPFQFHTGSIKALFLALISSVVELFQFHTGSIKACQKTARSSDPRGGFNSTLVRLKQSAPMPGAYVHHQVSIPHWFD